MPGAMAHGERGHRARSSCFVAPVQEPVPPAARWQRIGERRTVPSHTHGRRWASQHWHPANCAETLIQTSCGKERRRRHGQARGTRRFHLTRTGAAGQAKCGTRHFHSPGIYAWDYGTVGIQTQISRLSREISPSARTSKGFLITGTRVTSSRRQFKQTISKIRRLAT